MFCFECFDQRVGSIGDMDQYASTFSATRIEHLPASYYRCDSCGDKHTDYYQLLMDLLPSAYYRVAPIEKCMI